jgi:peptidoglycan/xylan/chitin deacetylase (PgdA/CDA1 family)
LNKVTLSFDNGPELLVTPGVLDCLAKYNLKATFFVLGRKVSDPACARIAQRARDEGHLIGNHTFSHTVPLGDLNREAALAEFQQTEDALAFLDQPERLFRPYGGKGSLGPHLLHPAVVERLRARRYTCVLWNSVPGDFRDPDGWVARALADFRSRAWSLVVLHDLPTGAMAHLDGFLRQLTDDGAEVTREFPPECTPMVDGTIVLPIDPYVQGS